MPRSSGENLQQRGLAGPVLADERVRFPFGDGERDIAQRLDGAERLGDVHELES
jgi:hypothetical protein